MPFPQTLGLVGFDVLDAISDTPLQLQKYRAYSLRTPVLKRDFADSPTVGQLVWIQMFVIHDALLLVVAKLNSLFIVYLF